MSRHFDKKKKFKRNQSVHLNPVGASDRHSHGHCDGWEEAETVQQRQAETLSVITGRDTGETRRTPDRKTTCRTRSSKSVTTRTNTITYTIFSLTNVTWRHEKYSQSWRLSHSQMLVDHWSEPGAKTSGLGCWMTILVAMMTWALLTQIK